MDQVKEGKEEWSERRKIGGEKKKKGNREGAKKGRKQGGKEGRRKIRGGKNKTERLIEEFVETRQRVMSELDEKKLQELQKKRIW